MSSVHVARQGFITKSALPSVSRARGSTTVADNRTVLLLNGNGTSGAQNNTFLDSSTNNFTITRNGNSTQGSFSPFTLPDGQWSNFFDGTGDFLVTGSGAALGLGTGNWTIEGWVNTSLPSKANSQWVVDLRPNGQGSATKPWLCIVGASNKFAYGVGGNSQILGTTVALPGVWYHFAVVKASGVTKLYVNGTQEGSSYADSNDYGSSNDSVIGTVGDARGTYDGYFNGYISNLRIVKGTAVYTSAFTPPTTNLTAITNTSLLTCQSNRFKDNSSNNFAITRNGDVRVTPWSPFAPTSAYDPATNGGSGYFDGTGDYLTSTTNSAFAVGTGDFTVEFFSYGIGTGDGLGICDTRANSGSAGFWISNNTAASRGFRYGTTGAVLLTVSGEVLNNWQHIAVVRNSGTVTIYVNGVSQGSVTDTRNYTDTSCFVGSFTGGAGPYFGYISNFRFVKGTAVYTSAFTPPTAPVTNITNTSLLLNFTNAGIFDAAGDCILETVGDVKIDTAVKKYGSGSLVFDGNTDALIISNNTPLLAFGSQNFTVECWFRRNNTNNVATIFRGDSGGGGGTGLEIIFSSSNDLIMGLNGGAPNIVTVSSGTHGVTTNTWYHGAFVRNGNTWTIYVNGVAVGSATNTSTISTPTFYRVGSNSFSTTMSFNGYIDDFRVTLGQARYTANFTPPTAELITYGTSDNIVNNSTYGVYQLA